MNSVTKERPYLKNLQELWIHMPRKHSDHGAAIWYVIVFKYFLYHETKNKLCHRGIGIWESELQCGVVT